MKHLKTIILIIILIALIVVKFVTKYTFIDEKTVLQENNSIISVDISNKTSNKYFLDKNSDGTYNISLNYIVLYDDQSHVLVEELRNDFEKRLSLFDNFIKQESENKMISKSELIFMNIEELGMKSLSYDKTVFEWIKYFYQRFNPKEYNTLVFVPIYEMNWCQDGLSQGFNYKGKVFFCMEAYFNPSNPIENKGSVGLMTHKFLHGFGFNHQNQLYKQYAFLDWYAGLPETNILLHGNFKDFDHYFFDEHTLKVLGLLNKTNFENKCLDKDEFVCESTNTFFCKNSWGPFCQDIDHDGIVDNEDSYVFSSPKIGNDSDADGIVDQLDLCDWNEISVSGPNVVFGPLKIKSKSQNLKVSFESKNLSVKKIVITPMEMIGGFIKFNGKNSAEIKGNNININRNDGLMWRIKVFYSFNNKDYFRSFYAYFPGFDADFFYEKEWYYFNRFGCDVPLSVNFADKNTYDSDQNGLPDAELFDWAKGINDKYDWDDDGFPDLIDSLPTVQGNCFNKYVVGVKDSDLDGFCDPGLFDFSSKRDVEIYEIHMIPAYNNLSDLCPYISGFINGCP